MPAGSSLRAMSLSQLEVAEREKLGRIGYASAIVADAAGSWRYPGRTGGCRREWHLLCGRSGELAGDAAGKSLVALWMIDSPTLAWIVVGNVM